MVEYYISLLTYTVMLMYIGLFEITRINSIKCKHNGRISLRKPINICCHTYAYRSICRIWEYTNKYYKKTRLMDEYCLKLTNVYRFIELHE